MATATATPISLRILSLPGSGQVDCMSTADLRAGFLVQDLFHPGELRMVYTDLDRLAIGGVVPATEMRLPGFKELGTRYFTERRELGIMNLGDPGIVTVRGLEYHLARLDCLYVGIEEEDVRFLAPGDGQPVYYLASCPAHRKYPTAKMSKAETQGGEFGDAFHASRRRINKYIHSGGIASCQLVMGLTELEPNSVWNTMPPHLHSRRSEIYLYIDLEDRVLFHLMGPPDRTRHLLMRDREAVLSPWWSIHAGAGTGNYRFIWVMAGENQEIGDVDPLSPQELA